MVQSSPVAADVAQLGDAHDLPCDHALECQLGRRAVVVQRRRGVVCHAIRGNQRQSVVIRGNQRQSEASPSPAMQSRLRCRVLLSE